MSGRRVHGKKGGRGREGGREGGRERERDLIKAGAILEMTVHLSWMGWPSYFMSLVTVSSDVMQEPAVDQIGRVIRISNNTPMQGSHVPHTEMNRLIKKFTKYINAACRLKGSRV